MRTQNKARYPQPDGPISLRVISDHESMFKKYYPGLCAFACRILKDPNVAEDIVQEVFMKFWRDRHMLIISESTQAYLYLATKNLSINYLKKQRRRSELMNIYLEDLGQITYNQDSYVNLQDLNESIEKAIELLPPKCRQVFELSRNHYKSHVEIAEQLKISPKTVANQIGKALKILRKNLSGFLMLFGLICIL